MKKKNKRGGILVGNIVFIILNLIFLTMLILFIARQGGGAVLLEQSYAKQIALIIDSAKPDMQIFLKMEDALEIVKDKWGEEYIEDMVKIKNNIVTVKLTRNSGYSYSFFNDINITGYFYTGEPLNGYIFNT